MKCPVFRYTDTLHQASIHPKFPHWLWVPFRRYLFWYTHPELVGIISKHPVHSRSCADDTAQTHPLVYLGLSLPPPRPQLRDTLTAVAQGNAQRFMDTASERSLVRRPSRKTAASGIEGSPYTAIAITAKSETGDGRDRY